MEVTPGNELAVLKVESKEIPRVALVEDGTSELRAILIRPPDWSSALGDSVLELVMELPLSSDGFIVVEAAAGLAEDGTTIPVELARVYGSVTADDPTNSSELGTREELVANQVLVYGIENANAEVLMTESGLTTIDVRSIMAKEVSATLRDLAMVDERTVMVDDSSLEEEDDSIVVGTALKGRIVEDDDTESVAEDVSDTGGGIANAVDCMDEPSVVLDRTTAELGESERIFPLIAGG